MAREKNGLKVILWNCFQFINRHELFAAFLHRERPDIVLLNELKMNTELCNYFLDITGYVSLYKSRNEHGGGVAVLIRNGLDYIQDLSFDIFNMELIAITIKIDSGWLGIINIYNPPNCPLSAPVFEVVSKKYNKLLIAGDLNSKTKQIGCRKDNANGDNLVKILEDNDLHVVNDHTPHIPQL